MIDPDLLTDDRPLDNEQRLARFYRRWHEWQLRRLAEEVEAMEDLIGMGEVLPCLRRQAD